MPPLCRLLRLNCSKAWTIEPMKERVVETPEDLRNGMKQNNKIRNVTSFNAILKRFIFIGQTGSFESRKKKKEILMFKIPFGYFRWTLLIFGFQCTCPKWCVNTIIRLQEENCSINIRKLNKTVNNTLSHTNNTIKDSCVYHVGTFSQIPISSAEIKFKWKWSLNEK